MFYQQGDVIIESVNSIPKEAKKISGKIVLAEGETTGHSHCIADVGCQGFLVSGNLFLNVVASSGVTVKHEEHAPIKIEPGVYQVRRVQEYDHFAEEAKNVQD